MRYAEVCAALTNNNCTMLYLFTPIKELVFALYCMYMHLCPLKKYCDYKNNDNDDNSNII